MSAGGDDVVERRGVVVAGEARVEVYGRRDIGAAGVDLQLAAMVVALERGRPQPLPPRGAVAAMRALTIVAALIAATKRIAAMGLAGHHNLLAHAEPSNMRAQAEAPTAVES